ncbi:MAG TPA: SsrA-binding protein SmpB [Polyangiaceae bacterium]|nr:SsrA-binding protein SmpB [Polyangiaceae bacterium]
MAAARRNANDEALIVKNRRASFDYAIQDRLEAGLVLVGSEVKAMRAGKVDLVDAYASVDRGEAWLKQMFVAPFEQASAFPHDPRRPRKLLLHAKEVEDLRRAVARDGFSVVPLRLYFKRGRVKVELAIAKGKKAYDKRSDMATKTAEREARAAMRRESR